MLSCISGLSIHWMPYHSPAKMSPDIAKCPLGEKKHPQLRTTVLSELQTGLWSKITYDGCLFHIWVSFIFKTSHLSLGLWLKRLIDNTQTWSQSANIKFILWVSTSDTTGLWFNKEPSRFTATHQPKLLAQLSTTSPHSWVKLFNASWKHTFSLPCLCASNFSDACNNSCSRILA